MITGSAMDEVLGCPTLPSLPTVAVEILELTGDANVPIRRIAETVQRDQALAGKVLKTVNSSFYGLSKPCGSIERAMAFLGMNTVKSLVLGFSLVDALGVDDAHGFDLMEHWRRAIVGAVAAREVALATRTADSDEAFTAGLFQDVGVLACFVALGGRYGEVVGGFGHGSWCARERDQLGFTHAQAGRELARKWKLPEAIQDAVGYHHAPDAAPERSQDLARAVALGAMVGSVLCHDAPLPTMRQIDIRSQAWFGKRAPEAGELLDRASEDARTIAEMFSQDIGRLPDARTLLAEAQDKVLEHQMHVQRESESLQRQAATDALTGLKNRKSFDEALAEAFARFRSEGRPMAVIFTDADRFKSVNDTHGHAAGDAVLRELALRIERAVGDAGLVARYGGEEIAVVLPGMGTDEASMLGERVRAEVAADAFDLSGVEGAPDELDVTISVGVSATDADRVERLDAPEKLLCEADACVYDAKRAGRNRVFVHQAADDTPVVPSHSAPVGPGGARVMIVEDDPLAATLITTLLKRQKGVSVQWIESGTRARTEIGRMELGEIPAADLFLVDLNLPGTSGYDLLRLVRGSASLGSRPFVILSAEEESSARAECERLGATSFIAKHEFVGDVGRWVGQILGKRAA